MSEESAGRKRRPIMIDSKLVDLIKGIAARHGMTVSAYMRALLTGAVEAEESSSFAPLVLRKALIYSKLRRVGVVLIPLSLLDSCNNANIHELAREEGRRLGALLRSLEIGLEEALDIMLEDSRIAIRERDKVILLPATKPGEKAVKSMIEGVAESYGAEITRDSSGVVTIALPEARYHSS
ncbi:hypothetical protein CF15_07550 [Pyrodictium occultum]|uniref:CopG family transcriptional regulator n=1 Tax=Pyrodictium occultum TaxID=2309 RepID=A0A0V8RWX3_PYROC|nr:hypothetical protein [Pyrodictium occultum]KSW12560.1 hypothetical protein CF15_07550 [Pyrodictium occultum]